MQAIAAKKDLQNSSQYGSETSLESMDDGTPVAVASPGAGTSAV